MKADGMRPLHEKIYLSCYFVPLYITKISEFIYGTKSNKGISETLKWMPIGDDKGTVWLERYSYEELPPELKKEKTSKPRDNRRLGRKYYYAKPEPLLHSIIDDLSKNQVTLSDIEEERLKSLLDSDEFRSYVHNHIHKYKRKFILNNYIQDFLFIKQALSRFCELYSEYNYFYKKKKFSNHEEMKEMFKERLSKDDVHIIPEITDIIEDFPEELIVNLSKLDSAVKAERDKILNMFYRDIKDI
jgi:hypothetical protein